MTEPVNWAEGNESRSLAGTGSSVASCGLVVMLPIADDHAAWPRDQKLRWWNRIGRPPPTRSGATALDRRAGEQGPFRQLNAPGESSNALAAGKVFHQISGGRDALGGVGHPCGDLAGAGAVFRSQDGAQIRDQRFLSDSGKAPGLPNP